MIELKYSFEYFCTPIWIKDNQMTDSIFENSDVEMIPISSKLKEEINELDVIYQSTFNSDYPPEPIKLSKKEELSFCKKVIETALRLSIELSPNYEILFEKKNWENRITTLEAGGTQI